MAINSNTTKKVVRKDKIAIKPLAQCRNYAKRKVKSINNV
jgi:hypothetical protein